MSAASPVRWHEAADEQVLQNAAVARILAAATRALAARGKFALVLAGGTTPLGVYRMLRTKDAQWQHWHIYFGDERCLARDDPARNSRLAGGAWLDDVPIPAAQIHVIPAELGAVPAAAAYRAVLQGIGPFNLVLLGLGEDGHTASLFPGRDWGTDPGAADVLAVVDAPKPPPERVSLSAARLGRTAEVLFLVGGENKRDAVARWRAGVALPAAAIRPAAGVDVLIEERLLRA